MTDDTRVLQALHVLRFDEEARRTALGEVLPKLEAAAAADRLIVVNDQSGWPLGFVVWTSDGREDSRAAEVELSWIASLPGKLAALLRAVARVHLPNLGISAYHRVNKAGERRSFRWDRRRIVATQSATAPPREDSSERILTEAWGRSRSFGYFDGTRRSLKERIRDAQSLMFNRLEPHASGRYLDVGSHFGEAAIHLSEQWQCRVVGLEPSTGLVDTASAWARTVPLARFVQCDLTDIPDDLGSFDGAFATDLLRKSRDPMRTLAGLRPCLRRASRFVLADRVSVGTRAHAADGRHPPTERQWKRMFSRSGFDVVAVEDWTSHAAVTLEHVQRRIDRMSDDACGRSRALSVVANDRDAVKAGRLGWHLWTLAAVRPPDEELTRATRMVPTPTTLVMLSGGIDSAYALWDTLAHTDHLVLAHHVHFRNREDRHVPEARACRNIVKWLLENCREFDYRETVIDHRGMAFFGIDMIAVGFEAGLAAHNFRLKHDRKVDTWRVGACADEPGWRDRWAHVLACCEATSFPHAPPAYADVPEITKAEQVRRMPRELAAMTWGCRTPLWRESTPLPCGRCHTCEWRKRLGFA